MFKFDFIYRYKLLFFFLIGCNHNNIYFMGQNEQSNNSSTQKEIYKNKNIKKRKREVEKIEDNEFPPPLKKRETNCKNQDQKYISNKDITVPQNYFVNISDDVLSYIIIPFLESKNIAKIAILDKHFKDIIYKYSGWQDTEIKITFPACCRPKIGFEQKIKIPPYAKRLKIRGRGYSTLHIEPPIFFYKPYTSAVDRVSDIEYIDISQFHGFHGPLSSLFTHSNYKKKIIFQNLKELHIGNHVENWESLDPTVLPKLNCLCFWFTDCSFEVIYTISHNLAIGLLEIMIEDWDDIYYDFSIDNNSPIFNSLKKINTKNWENIDQFIEIFEKQNDIYLEDLEKFSFKKKFKKFVLCCKSLTKICIGAISYDISKKNEYDCRLKEIENKLNVNIEVFEM